MSDDPCTTFQHKSAFDTPRQSSLAARLRGFDFVGILTVVGIYLSSMIVPALGALLVLAWAWRSQTPWREIGFARPASWISTFALGIALGVSLRLIMKFLVMPLLGAPSVNPAFHHLEGNTSALPLAIFLMGVLAPLGEEVVMRGFLFERARRLFGSGTVNAAMIVLGTSVIFGVGHYPMQGVAGAQNAALMGVAYGTLYLVTGRLWLSIMAHAAFNLSGLAIIYLGVGAELDAWFWGS